MPYAVTHVLAGIIVADVIRDYVVKDRRKFPLHLVLFCGIASLLPDADMIVYYLIHMISGTPRSMIHRQFTHTFMIPIILLLIAFALYRLGRTKHGKVLAVAALGITLAILLDMAVGYVNPFYPITSQSVGLGILPSGEFGQSLMMGLDAIILIMWLIHEQVKHKISDYM
jgi:membrane-bound metal-dependent hydrolase YbcI (DUF457 family)